MSAPLAVAVVEDTARYRDYLIALLAGEPRFRCVAACADAEEALARLPALVPDLIVVDLELPGQSGLELIPQLRAALPAVVIVVLTVCGDDLRLFGALQAGAASYLLKDATRAAELIESLLEAHAGGSPMSPAIARRVLQFFNRLPAELHRLAQLTESERHLLDLVAQGFLQKEIADQLKTTDRTVRNHLQKIYGKLHVSTPAEALALHHLAQSVGK